MVSLSLVDPAPAVPGTPPGIPSVVVNPTDIVALVLMALYAMRRMEVRTTDPRAFPEVPAADFESWKARAMHARNVSVNACFAKFFLNTVWFFGARSFVPLRLLQGVGVAFFFAWIGALAYAFWVSSQANSRAKQLGIVIGRRMIEERRQRPASAEDEGPGKPSSPSASSEAEEAS